METLEMVFRFIVVLPIVLILLIITLRYLNKKSLSLTKSNYLNVIEKVQVTKECTLAIIKTGDTAAILAITSGGVESIKELSEDELKVILENKEEHRKELLESYQKYFNKVKYRGQKK